MTDKTTRDELTPDERIFLQALDTANADLMVSIFTKVNGTLNEEKFLAEQPAPEQSRVDISTLTPAPLPPSHVVKEASRAREIDPAIRIACIDVLDELRTVIEGTAFSSVLRHRPHYRETSVFEGDVIATEILHGVCDFLALRPSIAQIDEYHTPWFYDVEDGRNGHRIALDQEGNTVYVDPDDPDDKE